MLAKNWYINDNLREGYMLEMIDPYVLSPNLLRLAENTGYSDTWQIDILSNGFKYN